MGNEPPSFQMSTEQFQELLADRVTKMALSQLKTIFIAAGSLVTICLAAAGLTYHQYLKSLTSSMTEQQAQLTQKTTEADNTLKAAQKALQETQKSLTDAQNVLRSGDISLKQIDTTVVPTLLGTVQSVGNNATQNVMTVMGENAKRELELQQRTNEVVKATDESKKVQASIKAAQDAMQTNSDTRFKEYDQRINEMTSKAQAFINTYDPVLRATAHSGVFAFGENKRQNISVVGAGSAGSFQIELGKIDKGNVQVVDINDVTGTKHICSFRNIAEGQGVTFFDDHNTYEVMIRSTVGIKTNTLSENEFAFLQVGWDTKPSGRSKNCATMPPPASGVYAVRDDEK
jgi:hypothetical protein